MTARDAPRVAFSPLVERGLVSAGARLVDAKRRVKALVRADGAIALGETVGSIHRIGALAQGTGSLQRLGVLAPRDRQGSGLDRCAARRDQGRHERKLALAPAPPLPFQPALV